MLEMPSAEEMRQLGKYDLEKEMRKLRELIIENAKVGIDHIKISESGSYTSMVTAIKDNYDTVGPALRDLGYEINFTDNMKTIIIRWGE
jgi:hypothetical protein